MWQEQVLPLPGRVDMGAIVIKSYTPFLKYTQLELHDRMQVHFIFQAHPFLEGLTPPLRIKSAYSNIHRQLTLF